MSSTWKSYIEEASVVVPARAVTAAKAAASELQLMGTSRWKVLPAFGRRQERA
jgi:hypothetical protein